MGDVSNLQRCIEVTRGDILAATESRQACKIFLDRLATISRPQHGGPLLLLLFARMATTACEWLDGDLRIELVANDGRTSVDVQTALGFGAAERVFPPFEFNLPLDEFMGAITRVPQMIWPLALKVSEGRILLSATSEVRASTMPPVTTIDVSSLMIPLAPPVPHLPEVDASVVAPPEDPPRHVGESWAPAAPRGTARATLPYAEPRARS